MAGMRDPWIDAVLLVLASPILAVKALWRAGECYRFVRLATRPSILCECGASVSLVGMWKCSCNFTYRGHLTRVCPVCGTVPCVVRCYRCGVTRKLPEAS